MRECSASLAALHEFLPALTLAHSLSLSIDSEEASDLAARDAIVEHIVAVVAFHDTIEPVPYGGLLRSEEQLEGCLPRRHRAGKYVAPSSILGELCGLIIEAETVLHNLQKEPTREHSERGAEVTPHNTNSPSHRCLF